MTWQVLCRQLAIWWFSRCLPRAISIYWSEKHSSSSTEGLISGIRRKKYGWSNYCNRNVMMNSKWKFEDTATVICDLWQSVNHSKWAAKMEEERLLLLGIWHEFDLSHHTCRRKERALLDQVQAAAADMLMLLWIIVMIFSVGLTGKYQGENTSFALVASWQRGQTGQFFVAMI